MRKLIDGAKILPKSLTLFMVQQRQWQMRTQRSEYVMYAWLWVIPKYGLVRTPVFFVLYD